MDLLSEGWLKNLISGVVMACLSVIIFGGVIYGFVAGFTSWIYFAGLLVGGFSTFVSSILMLYDSVSFKVKKEMKKEIQNNHQKRNKEIKNHIKVLDDKCERIKPKSISKQ